MKSLRHDLRCEKKRLPERSGSLDFFGTSNLELTLRGFAYLSEVVEGVHKLGGGVYAVNLHVVWDV